MVRKNIMYHSLLKLLFFAEVTCEKGLEVKNMLMW